MDDLENIRSVDQLVNSSHLVNMLDLRVCTGVSLEYTEVNWEYTEESLEYTEVSQEYTEVNSANTEGCLE